MKKVIIGLSLVSSMLFAQNNMFDENSVGLKIGTLGLGAEYSTKITDKLFARVGINGYSYEDSGTESDIKYDIDLNLKSFGFIADYYPIGSGFRLSGGLILNYNEADFKGNATGGTYTINDVVYNASDVGDLNGDVDFDIVAPYIGIGYSNVSNSGNWSFTAELGAMYQGDADVDLNVQCSTSLTTTQCSTLQDNVRAEENQLKDAINDYKVYPVLSFGLMYKF